jgi:hypothetical protein
MVLALESEWARCTIYHAMGDDLVSVDDGMLGAVIKMFPSLCGFGTRLHRLKFDRA